MNTYKPSKLGQTGLLSEFISRSVHAALQVQRLWFVPPRVVNTHTNRHTHRHTDRQLL